MAGTPRASRLFIAWTRYIRRPDSMQAYFGYELVFMKPPWERRWLKPFGYLVNSWKSLMTMIAAKPDVLWIQLAPPPLLYTAWVYRSLFNPAVRLVADCHNSAFLPRWFRWPLVRRLMNRCHVVQVHNRSMLEKARRAGIGEPPLMCFLTPPCAMDRTDAPPGSEAPPYRRPVVLSACSFEADEPLDTVFDAARRLPQVTFVITGETRRAIGCHDLEQAPENVVFTGFVSIEVLDALFEHADVVLALTLRPDCELSSANEALGFGKAMVISDTPVLRELFPQGALYVESENADAMAAALREAIERRRELEQESVKLKAERLGSWYRMADDFTARLDCTTQHRS